MITLREFLEKDLRVLRHNEYLSGNVKYFLSTIDELEEDKVYDEFRRVYSFLLSV